MRYSRGLRLVKVFITGVVGTLMGLGFASAGAASSNISHSYKATAAIPNGSIVSLDPQHSGYVQLATTANGSRLLGVALLSSDSLLAVDPGNAPVQVATSGSVNTLVSTLNGSIKVGDQISVSPFGGIGMAAMPGTHVVGVAQTAFNANSTGATAKNVKDKTGQTRRIEVGYVRLSISVGTSGNGATAQVNFLQKLAKSLTGHTISIIRILLSIVVTLIALVSLVTLIYASVYGSIVSIGRNPLAQHAVFRTLTSVMIMAVLTIAIACVTIFYLLH